jgi:nickel transport protein
MRLFPSMLLLLTVLTSTAPAWGHGVEGHIAPGRGYQVTVMYDDGEPMSYAAVEIMTAGEKIAFQSGRTDRNGIMLFLPDRPGPWQAVVTDGMGHRLALEVTVAEVGASVDTPAQTTAPPRATSRPQALITGIALIFGLFGMIYAWKTRRAARLPM